MSLSELGRFERMYVGRAETALGNSEQKLKRTVKREKRGGSGVD